MAPGLTISMPATADRYPSAEFISNSAFIETINAVIRELKSLGYCANTVFFNCVKCDPGIQATTGTGAPLVGAGAGTVGAPVAVRGTAVAAGAAGVGEENGAKIVAAGPDPVGAPVAAGAAGASVGTVPDAAGGTETAGEGVEVGVTPTLTGPIVQASEAATNMAATRVK